MRASRLLRILLLLQNRGRLTSAQLAAELEVAPRTILRDVDALTEAGLPIIAYQGNQGGIALGFEYRTRLTGLAADEAEALAVILARPTPELDALGMGDAAHRARGKIVESFPDPVRMRIATAQRRFQFAPLPPADDDPRVAALADAVRNAQIVRIRARSRTPREIHPAGLIRAPDGWLVVDARDPLPIPLATCGDINISARRFNATPIDPRDPGAPQPAGRRAARRFQ
jgi:predicted DNA-binding transcriptional regulator YafY